MSERRLHLIFNPSVLDDLSGQLTPHDGLVLLDRGAELLLRDDIIASLVERTEAVYCLGADRRARGLAAAARIVETDDAGLVGLVEAHQQILSWA